jgi:hypothetical protein
MERKVSDPEGVHVAQPFQRYHLQPVVGLLLVYRCFLGALAPFVVGGARGA